MARGKTKIEEYDAAMAVFNAVVEYKTENDGCSPSIRELCKMTGFSSTAYIGYLLDRLEEAGLIRLAGRFKARQIQIPEARWIYDGQR